MKRSARARHVVARSSDSSIADGSSRAPPAAMASMAALALELPHSRVNRDRHPQAQENITVHIHQELQTSKQEAPIDMSNSVSLAENTAPFTSYLD